MKKYIAKFEVEIEIEARNEKDANSLLKEIKFNKNSFGTKGEVRTIRSDLNNFYRADWIAIQYRKGEDHVHRVPKLQS